jgi:hypothetical protein
MSPGMGGEDTLNPPRLQVFQDLLLRTWYPLGELRIPK